MEYEPLEGARQRCWMWALPDWYQPEGAPWVLPEELFRHLPGAGFHEAAGRVMKFPTRQAALQALAVAMGRADKQ